MRFFVLIFLMTGCVGSSKNEPTPFTPSEKEVIVVGCEQLKKEIEEYNKTHNDKKIADC